LLVSFSAIEQKSVNQNLCILCTANNSIHLFYDSLFFFKTMIRRLKHY